MRILNLTLRNYRGFTAEAFHLDRPLTVLVGLNGSGKSSVLTAIGTIYSEFVRRSQMVQETMLHWNFEDVDIHEGANDLAATAKLTSGSGDIVVSTSFRRGQQVGSVGVPVAPWMRWRGAASPLAILYTANRHVAHGTRAFATPPPTVPPRARADLYDSMNPAEADGIAFGSLFRWFRDREDVENQTKVESKDLDIQDPQLAAVRRAVAGMLPGFSGLRVRRDPLHLVVSKGEEVLALDQLSDGEKLLLAMTADIGRRLAITFADRADPLTGEALVLIDEVELHLHAAWQRSVLVNLTRTFPGCQFIVTTHSPQVLSTVPAEAIILLRDFKSVPVEGPTKGRDSNAILREIFDVRERPEEALSEIASASRLLDEGQASEARHAIEKLEGRLGWQDEEVIRLRTRLEFVGPAPGEAT